MRELNECKAEVFRRSDNRIKERRRNRNRILAMCIPLCLVLTIFSVMMLPGMLPAGMDKAPEADGLSGNATTGDVGKPGNNKEDGNGDMDGAVNTDVPDNLSFSLTWNTYGMERDSQKGIIIGHKGVALKKVSTEARKSLEKFFGKSIYLEIFVKVDKDWRQSAKAMKQYGYDLGD